MSKNTLPTLPSRRRRASIVATGCVAAVITLMTAGCGSSTEGPSAGSGSSGTAARSAAETTSSEVPAACKEAFPVVVRRADALDLKLQPADLPAPPVDATLCETSSTMDDQVELASYATDATTTDVLDAYEKAFAAYDAVREDRGAGESVSAVIDGTSVEVTPRDGAFTVAFAAS